MTDDTSWMDPPQVPATRPCPRCDGTQQVPHPKFPEAMRLVDTTLRPAMESVVAVAKSLATGPLNKKDLDWEAKARMSLEKAYPPSPCPTCHGAGTIPMETSS